MAGASTSVASIGEASAAGVGMATGSTKIEERVVTWTSVEGTTAAVVTSAPTQMVPSSAVASTGSCRLIN